MGWVGGWLSASNSLGKAHPGGVGTIRRHAFVGSPAATDRCNCCFPAPWAAELDTFFEGSSVQGGNTVHDKAHLIPSSRKLCQGPEIQPNLPFQRITEHGLLIMACTVLHISCLML